MATKKSKTQWPRITVGSHLTVTEHEDGRTELAWDDDALLQEVRSAISTLEGFVVVTEEKVKKSRAKKDKV